MTITPLTLAQQLAAYYDNHRDRLLDFLQRATQSSTNTRIIKRTDDNGNLQFWIYDGSIIIFSEGGFTVL